MAPLYDRAVDRDNERSPRSGRRAVLRPVKGTRTERTVGLGKELWAAAGGGAAWIDRERDGWDRT
jgi:hypothetical protein